MEQCKIIAIANQKGGVGKTTTTVNLGVGLARAGHRVLLVDGDPQGSLTIALGIPNPDALDETLGGAMLAEISDRTLPKGFGILHHKEGVDLLPGNIELSGIELSLINAMSRETVMRTVLHQYKDSYQFKLYTKSGGLLRHPVAIPPGGTRGVRLDRLGYEYTLDGIADRILQNMRKQVPFPEAEKRNLGRYRCRGSFRKYPKATGFRALYLYYCYKLKIIINQPASVKRVSADLRADLIKLDRLIAQSRFLTANRIDTQQELESAKQKIQLQIQQLTQQRIELRNALKQATRRNDTEQITALKTQIHTLSAAIRNHKKEVSICDDVAQRSGAVKENMEQITRQQNTQGKENMDYEHSRRRSGTGRSNVPQWR